MMKQLPVAVIGAGVIGTSVALQLQRRGMDAILVDPQSPGSGTSSGNAGCFNESSVIPVSMPGVLGSVPKWLLDPDGPLKLRWSYLPVIAPWLVRFVRAGTRDNVIRQAQALSTLVSDAIGKTMKFAEGTAAKDLLVHEGGLVVYRTRESFDGETFSLELRRRAGVRVEELSAVELSDLEPALSSEYQYGRFYPGNGHCRDPREFVRLLAQHFVDAGGRVRAAKALDFVFSNGHVSAVRLEDGNLDVGGVVVCAGAFSKTLSAKLGSSVPLDTERGYHVMLPTSEAGPRHNVMDADQKIVVTPMNGGIRVAGTVELAGLAAKPNWSRADRLVGLAEKMYPGAGPAGAEVSRWMGYRPSMPDSLPVIGRSARASNAILAFGHGHVGLAAAVSTAEIVGDLVRGVSPEIDISPFAPDRF